MRTPTRFRAETKYTESTEKKANVNEPVMAAVGNGDGATAAVAGRDNWFHIRLLDDDNRLTQARCQLALSYDDLIYVAKAKDRKLTYYEFVAFIQDTDGETEVPVCPKFAQVVYVSENACHFATVGEAITHINALATGPLVTRLFLIKVQAGNFAEAANVTIPQYVTLEGVGEASEIELGANSLFMSDDSSLQDVVVESSNAAYAIAAVGRDNVIFRNVHSIQTGAAGTPDCFHVSAGSTNVRFHDCYAEVSQDGVGFHVMGASTADFHTCIAVPTSAYSAATYGFQVGDTATVTMDYCTADDATNFGDGLHLDAAGLTCITRWCTFAGADDDVNTGATSTWQHFMCQFDPDNSTIAVGTHHALPTKRFNQTVIVAEEGGDFQALSEAITWINAQGDAAAGKLYGVLMLDGNFAEAANVTIPQYVHVKAEGEGTILDMGNFELALAANSSLETITVKGTGSDQGQVIDIEGDYAILEDVRVLLTGANIGVRAVDAGFGVLADMFHVIVEPSVGSATGFYFDNAVIEMWACEADHVTNFDFAVYIDNVVAGATVTTKFCEFHALSDDVFVDVGSIWKHFACQFNPDNITVNGTEAPLDGIRPEEITDYARGRIIRGGAIDWGGYAAETDHFILVGDGTDIASKAFDWDDIAAGAGADMVHNHAGVGEGGEIPATGLDMGIGDMIFTAADGLLLLGPYCEISPAEWWSLRKQKATLSGAFHQEAGRWQGTRAVKVERGTTNLCANPSVETALAGWAAFRGAEAVTREEADSVYGDYRIKVVTPGVQTFEGVRYTSVAAAAATAYTLSVWVKGTKGALLRIDITDDGTPAATGVDFTATGEWERKVVTHTTSAGTTLVYLTVLTQNVILATTFYVDGAQCEQLVHATTYCDGTLGTGYAWTGAAHASTSTRTATLVNLDVHVGLVSDNATFSFRVVVQMPYDADETWPVAADGNWLFDVRGAGTDIIALTYDQANNRLRVYIMGADRLLSPQTFVAGDWLDIVVTLDFTGNSYKLYVNGIEEDTDSTALAAPTLTDWELGSALGAFQAGFTFSEYAAFDRVLTAIEVAGLYALQRPLVDAGALDKPSVYFAPVFNDLFFSMSTGKVGGANQPTWAAFQGNTMEYTFALNDLIHLPSQEIAHSYKEGSDILLHVHIVLDGSDVGDTVVNYEVEYTIGDQDEVMSAAVVVTSGDFVIDGGTADRMHLVIDVGTIAGATYLIQAALKIRFRRIALVGGGDAPSNDPFALMVGAHIEEDTAGSRTANTK